MTLFADSSRVMASLGASGHETALALTERRGWSPVSLGKVQEYAHGIQTTTDGEGASDWAGGCAKAVRSHYRRVGCDPPKRSAHARDAPHRRAFTVLHRAKL